MDRVTGKTRRARLRHGSCLEHGHAHGVDHASWSRRSFLSAMGITAGGMFALNGVPMVSYGRTPLLRALGSIDTDRILVLIQLNGGNDGLNTIVPIQNDIYYNARPGLSISAAQTVPLTPELGMHPSFGSFETFYGDGNMAILQTVGYPSPNLSHFRSTDIWVSASDSDVVLETGWAGRYLDTEFPDFSEQPPGFPLAVQIGGVSSMLFQGPDANMGMSLTSVELFSQIAATGRVYDEESVPQTSYGNEMRFVRGVANDSYQYADVVQTAAAQGSNDVVYPSPNPLADNLAVVAQLIKGNLGSKIYVTSLGSFDTHANQAGAHTTLLRYIAEAVTTFYADLDLGGHKDRVMVMTFSEFGRRVAQNASGGTDHGTSAPLFVFGGGVTGGLYGDTPDLSDLDLNQNLKHSIDFRSVYATVLADWFGLGLTNTAAVLGGEFPRIGFVTDPAMPTSNEPNAVPDQFTLRQNYPNPFNPTTTISYTLAAPSHVRLSVFDLQGRLVQRLVDHPKGAGPHSIPFDAGNLPSGTYIYRIETNSGNSSRKMLLVR